MSNKMVMRDKVEPLSESQKAYGRMTTRVQIASAVWTLWDRLRKDLDVDQQWLADRMGKDKSVVSRQLKGPGNWTLDSVGDLLEAMGGRLTLVEAHTYSEIANGEARRPEKVPRLRRIVQVTHMVYDDEPGGCEQGEVAFSLMPPRIALPPLSRLIDEKVETP